MGDRRGPRRGRADPRDAAAEAEAEPREELRRGPRRRRRRRAVPALRAGRRPRPAALPPRRRLRLRRPRDPRRALPPDGQPDRLGGARRALPPGPRARLPGRGPGRRGGGGWLASRRRVASRDVRARVAGDSAGANLALGRGAAAPGDLFAAQVLVYPFLDPRCDTYDRTIPDPGLRRGRAGVVLADVPPATPGGDSDLDPLLATAYAGLPRTLVQLAALDVLTADRAAARRPDGRRRGGRRRGRLPGRRPRVLAARRQRPARPGARDLAAFLARLA